MKIVTFTSERHIFLSVSNTTCTLLPMSTGEFVSNLRHSDRTHSHLDKFSSLLVHRYHHLVHNSCLARPQKCTAVFFSLLPRPLSKVVFLFWKSHSLSYDYVITRYSGTRGNDTIVVQLVIKSVSHPHGRFPSWRFKYFFNSSLVGFFFFVRPANNKCEKGINYATVAGNYRRRISK